jgi:hypothetical protein
MSEEARRIQARTFETPEIACFSFSGYIAKGISVFADKQSNIKAKGFD